MAKQLPGEGFLGWMGRQIGYVSKAIKTDVTAGSPASKQAPAASAGEGRKADNAASEPRVIYRNDTVEELPHPEQPNVKLRRTTIDEMIVHPGKTEDQQTRKEQVD